MSYRREQITQSLLDEWRKDASYQQFANSNTIVGRQARAIGGGTYSWMDGADKPLTQIFNTMTDWKNRRKKTAEEHAKYVQLKTDTPGRAATILTVPGETTPSLLGK